MKRHRGRTARPAGVVSKGRALVKPASPAAFPRVVAAARRAAGLTQAGLAVRLGTTQSAVARLEHGEVTPSIATLSRLANALGVQFEVHPRSGFVVREPVLALTLGELRARRGRLLAIAARHGARDVRVFGSVARGDARPDSDVDFLVELEPDRTVLDLSGLILDFEDMLGRKVHVVEVRHPSRVADEIRREAVAL